MKVLRFDNGYLVRLDRGEEVTGALERFLEDEGIHAGTVSGRAGSVNLGDEGLVRDWGSDITLVLLSRGQLDRLRRQVFVGDEAEQMVNAVEAGAFLVVGLHHVPRRLFDIGALEHLIFGF